MKGPAGDRKFRDCPAGDLAWRLQNPEVIQWQADPECRAALCLRHGGPSTGSGAAAFGPQDRRPVTFSDELAAELESNWPPTGKACPRTWIFWWPLSRRSPHARGAATLARCCCCLVARGDNGGTLMLFPQHQSSNDAVRNPQPTTTMSQRCRSRRQYGAFVPDIRIEPVAGPGRAGAGAGGRGRAGRLPLLAAVGGLLAGEGSAGRGGAAWRAQWGHAVGFSFSSA